MNANELEDYDGIRSFLSTSLREQFPNLTLRKATGFSDILDIVSFVYKTFKNELDEAKTIQSLRDYATLPESTLDDQLANWNATRSGGNKARGTIRLYFREPETVEISTGSAFTPTSDTTIIFHPLRSYSFSTSYFMSHVATGFYYCDVEVEAADVGTGYNIEIDTAFTASNIVRGVTLDRVVNILEMSGGVDKETNEEYYIRAIKSFISRELTARGGVIAYVKEQLGWVKDALIVGPGDEEMERDVVQDLIDFPIVSPYMSGAWIFLTFLNKIRASILIPHAAYKFQFSANEDLPTLDELLAGIIDPDGTVVFDADRNEVQQEDYDRISKADAALMVFATGIIFRDDFNREFLFDRIGKIISAEYILANKTLTGIDVGAGWIQDTATDFPDSGVLLGDYLAIVIDKENIIGSETVPPGPVTADEINIGSGFLRDDSMEFLGVVILGDILYLMADISGVLEPKSCTVLSVEAHKIRALIPSLGGGDTYTLDYWVVREGDRIIEFKITGIEKHKLYMSLFTKYNYLTRYAVKRNEYEFVETGWKVLPGTREEAVGIHDGMLRLGYDPDKDDPDDYDRLVVDAIKQFDDMVAIIGKEEAEKQLKKLED
ncbi:MAG: baseplate J/gp47 family protein [Candidatus Krumholzibacteria bacterium]|nr:baseplate J/gp47 family protein [Candidatus Krumholzibacteria bacterium]